MDRLGLAGVSGRRDRRASSNGRRTHLRTPLCAVYACWDCWPGRPRRPRSSTPPINPLASVQLKKQGNRRPNGSENNVDGQAHKTGLREGRRREPTIAPSSGSLTLEVTESTELREQLLVEIGELGSSDDAAAWAHRNLRAKNNLAAADAGQVEAAFQARLAACGDNSYLATPARPQQRRTRHARYSAERVDQPSELVDKSVLAIPERRRVRDRNHVKTVAKQSCLICDDSRRTPTTCALRRRESSGVRSATSLRFHCVEGIVREVHHCGDEPGWWEGQELIPSQSPARCG